MLIFHDGYQITVEKSKFSLDETWYGYVSLEAHPNFHFWDCTTEAASLAECLTATIKECDRNSLWYGFKPDFLLPNKSWVIAQSNNDF